MSVARLLICEKTSRKTTEVAMAEAAMQVYRLPKQPLPPLEYEANEWKNNIYAVRIFVIIVIFASHRCYRHADTQTEKWQDYIEFVHSNVLMFSWALRRATLKHPKISLRFYFVIES